MKNILILFGGASGEHDVSCRSAASVLSHIDTSKYNIVKVGITKEGSWYKTDASAQEIASGKWKESQNIRAVLSPDTAHHGLILENGEVLKIDVVFPVMHGDFCEDGCLQGLCEMAQIPYVGSGVLSSAACMDKSTTKLFVQNIGIPQADWLVVPAPYGEDDIERILQKFTFPLFVKPCSTGSSLGVSKVSRREDLEAALAEAARHDDKILCEEFINGHEVECAVLGNRDAAASAVGEITPSGEFYDYQAKYIDDKSGLTIPAPLPEETTRQIRDYSVRIYQTLMCRGLARADFFVHKTTGKVYFNEINTLPGFTSISMYPKLWDYSGIPYGELIDRLIAYAEQ